MRSIARRGIRRAVAGICRACRMPCAMVRYPLAYACRPAPLRQPPRTHPQRGQSENGGGVGRVPLSGQPLQGVCRQRQVKRLARLFLRYLGLLRPVRQRAYVAPAQGVCVRITQAAKATKHESPFNVRVPLPAVRLCQPAQFLRREVGTRHGLPLRPLARSEGGVRV